MATREELSQLDGAGRSFLPQAMHPYYDRWRALQKG